MLKDNNYWVSEDVKGGLYIGCYDDMLTIKVGQTLGSIRHRALQIDQNADGHFIVQRYYQFKYSFNDKPLNEIYALAMEDLLHNWMTQFCSTYGDGLRKYRGEDHYECSQTYCEAFFHDLNRFDYFDKIFSSYDERLYNIISNYSRIILNLPRKKALVFLLRTFNGVQAKDRIPYKSGEDIQNERLAKIGLAWDTLKKMSLDDLMNFALSIDKKAELKRAGAEAEVGRGWFLQVKKKFIDALLEEDE